MGKNKLTAREARTFKPLDLRREAGGLRHYLHGIDVHCGQGLELLGVHDPGGQAIPVRYEASQDYGGPPGIRATLYTAVGGHEFVARIHDEMKFRWPGLAERLERQEQDAAQEKQAAKLRRLLASPSSRLRIDPKRGPVVLAIDGHGKLVACDEAGRVAFVWADEARHWPKAETFRAPIGPLYPAALEERCWCHKLPNRECPRAEPCIGGCGRRTTVNETTACGYCRFCSGCRPAEFRFPIVKPPLPLYAAWCDAQRRKVIRFRIRSWLKLSPAVAAASGRT